LPSGSASERTSLESLQTEEKLGSLTQLSFTPVQQDTSTSDESDDEEPLMAKRKKAKPADWDFRIAAVDLTDGKEVIDDESISTTVSVDRYSSDHDVDNEEEMSSLHYNRVNQAEEKDSNTNLSKREALKKREKILEVFDLCSDDEDVRAVQEHEGPISALALLLLNPSF
jgi:hypothetical protein